MKQKTEKSIADSLEVESPLLPYMPYLLQDLWALGSSIEKIIELIEKLKFNKNLIRFLDLGCGKGAVSIQIASKFGYSGLGVDAMEDFLNFARKKAKELGVSDLCDFQKHDILDFTQRAHHFNFVILASLGGIFGNYSETVRILRNQVDNGGYIVIDDGYLTEKNRLDRKGYDHYRNYDETIRELTQYDDRIIMEIETTDDSLAINDEYLKNISLRCKELGEQYPELNESINRYIELQGQECEVIESEIEGMIWVLQKSSN